MTDLARFADQAMEFAIAPSWSRFGFDLRRRLEHWDDAPEDRLDGRVVVLTGATSGIGRAAAVTLARRGARLHLVGRDEGRLDAVSTQLRTAGAEVDAHRADMADLRAVRSLAEALRSTGTAIDVLIHNAGALANRHRASPQGIEETVAAQILGPFLLTSLLLDRLGDAADGGRVLTVTSGGMYPERLELARLEMHPEHFNGVRAYARAKRAQVELTRAWAERPGVVPAFHAVHPGWVDTPGVADALPGFHTVTRPILRSVDAGADTLVWLSGRPVDTLGPDGGLWFDRHRRSPSRLPGTRTTRAQREELWEWCRERTEPW